MNHRNSNKVLLEFNSYKDPKTKASKLQILDKNLNTLAVLDSRDFEEMKTQGKDSGNHKHIIEYCNAYKAPFSVDVNNFKATIF